MEPSAATPMRDRVVIGNPAGKHFIVTPDEITVCNDQRLSKRTIDLSNVILARRYDKHISLTNRMREANDGLEAETDRDAQQIWDLIQLHRGAHGWRTKTSTRDAVGTKKDLYFMLANGDDLLLNRHGVWSGRGPSDRFHADYRDVDRTHADGPDLVLWKVPPRRRQLARMTMHSEYEASEAATAIFLNADRRRKRLSALMFELIEDSIDDFESGSDYSGVGGVIGLHLTFFFTLVFLGLFLMLPSAAVYFVIQEFFGETAGIVSAVVTWSLAVLLYVVVPVGGAVVRRWSSIFKPRRRRTLETYPDNWDDLRRMIYERDHYECANCAASDVELHAHHIVPLSLGGTNRMTNLITLCRTCHELLHPHMTN